MPTALVDNDVLHVRFSTFEQVADLIRDVRGRPAVSIHPQGVRHGRLLLDVADPHGCADTLVAAARSSTA